MSLESLASTIQAKSAELAAVAKDHGFEATLENSADLTSVAPLAVRNELIQAAKDLLYLASGPTDHVLGLAWSVCTPTHLYISSPNSTLKGRRHIQHRPSHSLRSPPTRPIDLLHLHPLSLDPDQPP